MPKEELSTPSTKEKILCGKCKAETNHTILSRFKTDDEELIDGGPRLDWWDWYDIIQCCGCDSPSFRHTSYFSDNDWFGGGGVEVKLYPHREKEGRSILSFVDTPRKLDKLYGETVSAYNTELLALCAGGVRAIIECICNDKGILGGNTTDVNGVTQLTKNLQGKISGLAERGHITTSQSEGLHQHRYLGNEALHEIKTPSRSELAIAIDILEHAIKQIYEIPENIKKLEALRHKRNSSVRSPSP